MRLAWAEGGITLIVCEQDDAFVMIEQHHHAILSGDMALYGKDELFVERQSRTDVQFAIAQHDRAWIPLDVAPLWNDDAAAPYSFIDYPFNLKLPFYRRGVDEVEQKNPYAALLCSLHYSSFFSHSTSNPELSYYTSELERQDRLRKKFADIPVQTIEMHVEVLKFFDNVSLYLCLNEPGVSKEHEFPWFRNGVARSELLPGVPKRIDACWINDHQVGLEPFPFKEKFGVSLLVRLVSKRSIRIKGLVKAHEDAPTMPRNIEIRSM